jgi:hypothetical protein
MQRAKSEKKNDALIASGESNISIFCEKSGGKLEAGSRDYVVVMSALIHFSILFFSFLIGSAIMAWWNKPRAKRAPKPVLNQRDWMEDFNNWMLSARPRTSPPASSASTAVGEHRVSGSALSPANRVDQFRS